MVFFESIDWASLSVFFDEHGKLITTIIAFAVGIISLVIAYLKYRHGVTEDSIRKQLEKLLKQKQSELSESEKQIADKQAALQHIDSVLARQRDEIYNRETALNTIRSAFKGKEGDLWCIHPRRPPANYERLHAHGKKPIILIANLKGGVGKSTLTANLAAYFCEMDKRVLLLDCDYQGSLSNMVQSADGVTEVPSGVINVLSPDASDQALQQARRQFLNILPNASIVPARYELASLENRILIEYLLQEDKDDDGRYRLAKAILSDKIIDSFDIALIDSPPRLTAAAINAFCASTHVLIPTLYDGMSSEAVGTFYEGIRTLKNCLNPGIEVLGVVGMLTYQRELKAEENDAKLKAQQEIREAWHTEIHFFERHIPRRQAIARAAGEKIAFSDNVDAHDLFSVLGKEISLRLGLTSVMARKGTNYMQSISREIAASP
jgi:cellulose biosynthesis protein BcsQ